MVDPFLWITITIFLINDLILPIVDHILPIADLIFCFLDLNQNKGSVALTHTFLKSHLFLRLYRTEQGY